MSQFLPRKLVVKLAIITESFFITASLLWAFFSDLSFSVELSRGAIMYGLVACAPMLIFNILVFGYLSREGSPYPIYGEFKRAVVIPLCGNLELMSASLLALSSGVAEELFFRGALFSELSRWLPLTVSAALVAALFSYVHFIGVFARYWQVALCYFFFGLYFCAIVVVSKSLLSAIVAHALYNFLVICYLRYVEIPRFRQIDTPPIR